jgi:adenine-specific DNA-methyltransferase
VKQLTYHPVADMFPLMEGEAFNDLVEDIKKHGQRHAILAYKGQIIDGRNRYRACLQLKNKPLIEQWDGKGSLTELSCSLNFHRRHLTASQRAATGAIAEEEFSKEAAARMKAGGKEKIPEGSKGQARDQAAKACGVNPRYITDAKLVRHHDAKLFQQLVEGKVTISQATRVVKRAGKKALLTKKASTLPPLDPSRCKIVHRDCLEFLSTLPAKSVRLVFADPPYNIGIDYGKGAKADQISESKFADWCQSWFEEIARVLTPDGSAFIMIDAGHACEFGVMLSAIGVDLHPRNLIVWHETFGNYTNDNFTGCARFIHYVTKDPKRWVFNGDAIRITSDRQSKYGDKRADPAGKVPGNVWQFPRMVDNHRDRMPGFPTQLPLELVERIVLVASDPGDLVVDPFVGSGTTPVAAMRHGRAFAGCDSNAKYVAEASRRMQSSLDQMAALASKEVKNAKA